MMAKGQMLVAADYFRGLQVFHIGSDGQLAWRSLYEMNHGKYLATVGDVVIAGSVDEGLYALACPADSTGLVLKDQLPFKGSITGLHALGDTIYVLETSILGHSFLRTFRLNDEGRFVKLRDLHFNTAYDHMSVGDFAIALSSADGYVALLEHGVESEAP